ncbi:MAG TPA: thioesterase family protein [Thermoanaerobaculia bacterium]|nr:thioesterase family protein [Thermoanaerobaculia bacterium]
MKTVETRLRVRYSETDRMGIVYHGHYIAWFEIGRTEYCRAAGVPYRALEDSGLLILVTAVECKYRRSARYDDEVRVATSLSELATRGLAFTYEVFDAEARLLARGATRHVFADAAGKPVRAPAAVIETLSAFRASD